MAFLAGYNRRKKITIAAAAQISADLTDQPVAIHIGSGETDFWNNNPPAAGSGVRFTSSDGTTLLKFEVESYNTTDDDGWWHVKVPTLSASVDTDIYMYFAASTETSGEDINNTWDANFKAVYHLNQDNAAGAFADSTVNANNGTNAGTIDAVGQIGRARSFDGTNDTISIPNASTMISDAVTVEVIMNASIISTATKALVDLGNNIFTFGSNLGSNKISFMRPGTGQIHTSVSDLGLVTGTFYHIVLAHNGGTVNTTNTSILIDGVSESLTLSGSVGLSYNAATAIGSDGDLSSFFNGILEEVTKSDIGRSADWAKARNQSRLGTWLTIAAMETSGGALLQFTAETIQSSEALGRLKAMNRPTGDTESVSEAVARRGALRRVIDATVSLSESILKNFFLVAIANAVIQIAESVGRNRTIGRVLNETVQLAEARVGMRGMVRIVTETMQVTEDIVKWIAQGVAVIISSVKRIFMVDTAKRVFRVK